MSKNISTNCKQCHITFDYPLKEFNRQNKLGRSHGDLFCSISCATIWKNKNRSFDVQNKINKSLHFRMIGNAYSKKGEFTFYLNKSRNRKNKNLNFDLDELYLKELWEKQNQKCALSGINIYLKKGKNTPITASLDRIDNKKGYIKNNVQFVAYSINLAKNSFSDDQIIKFIDEIRNSIK